MRWGEFGFEGALKDALVRADAAGCTYHEEDSTYFPSQVFSVHFPEQKLDGRFVHVVVGDCLGGSAAAEDTAQLINDFLDM